MIRHAVLFVFLVAPLALAEGLKPGQEEEKEKFQKQVASQLKEVDAACGTKLAMATDFENFDKADFNRNPPAAVCSTLIYAVKTTCASGAYKKAVASKLKGLACLMGGNKTEAKDFAARFFVKDGIFTFKMDRDGSGGIEATQILKAFLDQ